MYEINNLVMSNLQNTCRCCLKVDSSVRVMTSNELNTFMNWVIKKSPASRQLHVCSICGYLLSKAQKFVNQCCKADSIFNSYVEHGMKKELSNNFSPLYNLKTSTIHISEFISEADEHANYSDDIYNDDEDIPLVMLKTEDSVIDEKELTSTLVKKKKKKKKRHKNVETKENNTASNNLRNESNRSDINNTIKEEIMLEYQEVNIENIGDEQKVKEKVLKEGFTSRMRQETDEYIVIKLSKKEVIQEMEEKSQSEEYAKFLFKCDQCVKGFNFEDVLRSHMERHVKKKGWLECELCHQYCPSVISLRGHMKSHTTRYKCKVCACVRLSRQVLLEHHSTIHTQHAINYTCQLCDFVSVKRTSMQRHVRTAHCASEKHACEQCGKLFKTIEALRVHNTRHDKSKCLRCDECNRKFIFPSLLKQHKKAVHERDDYYCVECDVKFSSRTNLSLHFKRAKKHRDLTSFKYECSHCSQRFLYRSTLSTHVAAHEGEKQHACSECSKRYSNRDSLRAHQHTHDTRQRKNVLRAHLRSHGNDADAILTTTPDTQDDKQKIEENLNPSSEDTTQMDVNTKSNLS